MRIMKDSASMKHLCDYQEQQLSGLRDILSTKHRHNSLEEPEMESDLAL